MLNKVITTTVIRPLDDRTHCARSAFTPFEALTKATIVHRIIYQLIYMAYRCRVTAV